ncbi:MAG: ferritin family protein [Bacillota bacterium]
MWKVFKAGEIIDFAVQIEKNGEKFYSALAKNMEDEKLKQVFSSLAEEERQHIKDFQKIMGDLTDTPVSESYPGEYEEYVKGLAENHVFKGELQENQLLGKIKGPMDAISLAIGFEQDSLLFFHELKELVSPRAQETVEKLIKEEKLHIVKLMELKRIYSCSCLCC